MSVPAQITAITTGVLPMAQLNGRVDECCLAYLRDAQVGDYVLVQNGFAVSLLDAQSAAESLQAFAELGWLPQG